MNSEVRIESHKKVQKLLLIGVFLFFVTGLWFLFFPPKIDHPFFENPIILRVLGAVEILFSLFAGFYLSRNLQNLSPAMILNDQFVLLNMNYLNDVKIDWDEVTEAYFKNFSGQMLLAIHVKEPERIIDGTDHFMDKKTMETNFRKYGTPIYIPISQLKISPKKLEELLINYLK